MKNVRYNIRACKTTDGKLFENTSEAENHQRRLDFEHWYNSSAACIPRDPDIDEFTDFLLNNKNVILDLLGSHDVKCEESSE